MKREGRQHGMVRSYPIIFWPPLDSRPGFVPGYKYKTHLDPPPTAGLFAKVSSKPTNQSKSTGKCPGEHSYPVSKSKTKAKGTQKQRSHDVFSDHRLVSWRVVDSKPGFKFAGFSASVVLDHLDGDDDDCLDEVYDESCMISQVPERTYLANHGSLEFEIGSGAVDIKDYEGEDEDEHVDEHEHKQEYKHEQEHEHEDEDEDEDEDWFLVPEM